MRRTTRWLWMLQWCAVAAFGVSNAAVVLAQESGTIRLSPAEPTAEWSVVIEAPGYGVLRYKVFGIDVSSFHTGGVLNVDVYVAPDSKTAASFNIFPEGVRVPTEGHPYESVAGAYDVPPGVHARLEYRFERGQTVSFGADGNWFSPTGARGNVSVRATVQGASTQTGGFDGTYYSEEFRFGFRISGSEGVATVSNSSNYQVGDVMLRFAPTGERSFRGEQLCTDGAFHPITAELNAAGDLEMTIQGCGPSQYTMVRQREPAGVEAVSSSGASVETTGVPFARGQVWRGQYLCSQGLTSLDLVILGVEADGVDSTGGPAYRVSARFDFNFGDGAAEGAFLLSGTYQSSDRAGVLRAREWIQRPDSYFTVDMEGQVSADGQLFSGMIRGDGCGAFSVRRTDESWVQEGASGASVDTTGVPFARGQVWRGQYRCAQGMTNLDLVILGAEPDGADSAGGRAYRVSAIFDFNFDDGAAEGAFFLSGAYRSSDRTAAFRAREWIRQPDGYVTVDMDGQVSADGQFFSGTIPGGGCGAFAVRRTSESWVQEGAPAESGLGACGSSKDFPILGEYQRFLVGDYLCFSSGGLVEPLPGAVCAIGVFAGYKPVYFGESCLSHDRCYGKSGSRKSQCDEAFLAQMEMTCDASLTDTPLSWLRSRETCRGAALVAYQAVRSYGCEAFITAQRMAGAVDPTCD